MERHTEFVWAAIVDKVRGGGLLRLASEGGAILCSDGGWFGVGAVVVLLDVVCLVPRH
jgi:hypothetical protein